MHANQAIAGSERRASTSARSRWHDRLADGTPVVIRPIRKSDVRLESEFLKHLSERSLHDRFLSVVQTPVTDAARRFTDVDNRDEVALIAVVRREGHDVEVGAAGYCHSEDRGCCHVAVAIDDNWRRRGLAILLMGHLIEIARANGVQRMYAADAVGGEKTHQLAARLGFRRRPDPEDPAAVTYELVL